ncbi:NUMOD4 domain-containing protein [Paenibacillus sp. FSL L8-0340]|uniref:NUMOD4 domain-containing protein n=1 Tax=Paenibacillus sp. FSL L8-0340 TaxID=2954685 RepID=UPI0031580F90
MEEERKDVEGYEEIYEITRSGRIISIKTGKARHRNGDAYGYANVHLHKNGDRELAKTFELWKHAAFPEASQAEYKGRK